MTDEELATLAALNDEEDLAPQPSRDDLFGEKMEALKKEFASDTERYEKSLADNQNKVQQSLQDKLAARRQKRARKNIEEKEKSVLT